MTEVPFQSRTDVGDPNWYPRSFQDLAGAAAGKNVSDTGTNALLRAMTTYIPTEVLTVYVAVVGALGDSTPADNRPSGPSASINSLWIAFWCFLVATPIVIWVTYATKVKTAGKPVPAHPGQWPWWEMIAGTIAYAAWAFGIPGSAFSSLNWYSAAVAGVVVLVASTALGLLAPLFARQIKA